MAGKRTITVDTDLRLCRYFGHNFMMNPPLAVDNDPFDLDRFLEAQESVYERVQQELRSGQKRSHWIWYVFPQFDGLGTSSMSHRYAVKSLQEARDYLHHPVLGQRLVACTRIVNHVLGRSARQIFGSPDDMKFRSSMTLFELAAEPQSEFALALEKYFAGERDARTLELVGLP